MAREGILRFLFATTALPGFQSEGNSLIHDSVTAHCTSQDPTGDPEYLGTIERIPQHGNRMETTDRK